MASAWPDLWSSAFPSHDIDRRGTLLRLQAEMFVAARARDTETIRTFEAMALGFLPRADEDSLLAVAQLVAPCPDTPEAVLTGLALHSARARAVIAASAPCLPTAVIDLLLGSPADRPALAARPDLDDRSLDRLLVLDDGAVNAALAANLSLRPGHPAFGVLLRRARERRALAAVLLERGDLAVADEAALYLHADYQRQGEIRKRVAGSVLFQRLHAPPRLSEADTSDLLALAERGDVHGFEETLSAILGLPSGIPWRLLETGRHDLLALALSGLGMQEEDATRILLTLHPAIAHSLATVFSLSRLMREVSRSTALTLVEAILGTRADTEPSGRHVPAWDDSGTPARSNGILTERARPMVDGRRHSGS